LPQCGERDFFDGYIILIIEMMRRKLVTKRAHRVIRVHGACIFVSLGKKYVGQQKKVAFLAKNISKIFELYDLSLMGTIGDEEFLKSWPKNIRFNQNGST
jgi:hypothetical protein